MTKSMFRYALLLAVPFVLMPPGSVCSAAEPVKLPKEPCTVAKEPLKLPKEPCTVAGVGVLNGRVYIGLPNGELFVDAVITVKDKRGVVVASKRTDAKGNFTFDLPIGVYDVEVRPRAVNLAPAKVKIEVKEGKTTRVEWNYGN